MTRIWSGRLQDQVYAGMAERLVRQSNNARLDPNEGVNPRVRRILARMHRAGLLENMAGLWLPDMYTADGENRVERMGGLTAQGALEQPTEGNKPILTTSLDGLGVVSFDGASQRLKLDVSGALSSPTDLTVFAFVKPQSFDAVVNDQFVSFDNGEGGSDQLRWQLRARSNATSCNFAPWDIGNRGSESSQSIPLDEWSLVAGSLNISTQSRAIYINGQDANGSNITSGFFSSSGEMVMGWRRPGVDSSGWEGTFAALGIATEFFTPEKHAALHEILTEAP